MKSYKHLALLTIFLICGCNHTKDSSSTHTTPQPLTIASPAKTKTNSGPETDPKEKDIKEASPKDKETETKEKDAPCCHSSADLMFRAIEAQAKLVGLEDLHPLKDYQGKLSVQEGSQNIDGTALRVRANMPDMNHGEIEFITKQINPSEFQIEGMVFTMPGKWNVSFQFINADEEILDACQCEVQVKE